MNDQTTVTELQQALAAQTQRAETLERENARLQEIVLGQYKRSEAAEQLVETIAAARERDQAELQKLLREVALFCNDSWLARKANAAYRARTGRDAELAEDAPAREVAPQKRPVGRPRTRPIKPPPLTVNEFAEGKRL